MNNRTDRPTPIERQGAPDCLVEMGLEWLRRPLDDVSDEVYAAAIAEICLVISQMRHRGAKGLEAERLRWIDRVVVRLCQQRSGVAGYEGAARVELERRVELAMLRYRDWREKVAPKFSEARATGQNDGGEVAA